MQMSFHLIHESGQKFRLQINFLIFGPANKNAKKIIRLIF